MSTRSTQQQWSQLHPAAELLLSKKKGGGGIFWWTTSTHTITHTRECSRVCYVDVVFSRKLRNGGTEEENNEEEEEKKRRVETVSLRLRKWRDNNEKTFSFVNSRFLFSSFFLKRSNFGLFIKRYGISTRTLWRVAWLNHELAKRNKTHPVSHFTPLGFTCVLYISFNIFNRHTHTTRWGSKKLCRRKGGEGSRRK